MFYIRLTLLFLVLSGCAQIPAQVTDTVNRTPSAPGTEDLEAYRQALNLMINNNLDSAADLFKKVNIQHPDLAGPLANLGLISLKKNELDKAETYLAAALQRNPQLHTAHNSLGMLYYRRGKMLQAEKSFLAAIKIRPDYPLAHYNLALLYDIFLNNISKAIEHYQSYLQLTGNKDNKTQQWLNNLKALQKNG